MASGCKGGGGPREQGCRRLPWCFPTTPFSVSCCPWACWEAAGCGCCGFAQGVRGQSLHEWTSESTALCDEGRGPVSPVTWL